MTCSALMHRNSATGRTRRWRIQKPPAAYPAGGQQLANEHIKARLPSFFGADDAVKCGR